MGAVVEDVTGEREGREWFDCEASGRWLADEEPLASEVDDALGVLDAIRLRR